MYEFSRVGVVGMNATDLGSGQKDIFRLLMIKEVSNSLLAGKIQIIDFWQKQVFIPTNLKTSHKRGSYKPI
jgi:hypothetical protein